MASITVHRRGDGTAPIRQGILQRLRDRAEIGRCPHLGPHPDTAAWLPWAPGRLRCEPCADQLARLHRGAATCDGCGQRRRLHVGIVLIEGLDELAGTTITVPYALCRRCWAADG